MAVWNNEFIQTANSMIHRIQLVNQSVITDTGNLLFNDVDSVTLKNLTISAQGAAVGSPGAYLISLGLITLPLDGFARTRWLILETDFGAVPSFVGSGDTYFQVASLNTLNERLQGKIWPRVQGVEYRFEQTPTGDASNYNILDVRISAECYEKQR